MPDISDRYADPARTDLVVVQGMGHPLANEPGEKPAPQTRHAAVVDHHAVAWLRTHLSGSS